MSEKETKDFHITHSGELLIWLIIVLIFVSLSTIFNINKEKNDLNDYQIFLQDVDGLIVGSPVRMMGIEVGYVKKIKPTNKEVYVKFVVTNPDVYIPQGTSATVEFSGMAGSKSLELFIPDSNTKNNAIISTIEPHRINDFYNYQNQIARIIITMSSDFMNMFNENNTITIKKFVKSPNEIKQTHKKLDEINNTEEKIIKRLNEYDKKQ